MSHARLGPSNHRWPHCPGSVREEAAYPNTSSAAAIDGTGSHLLLEMCLENGVGPLAYEGQIIGANHKDNPMGWMVHRDRCDRVQVGLTYVSRRVGELKEMFPGCEVIVEAESKSYPGKVVGRDDWWGTCDITLTAILDEMVLFVEVVDYKDGRGWVTEKNNGQLIDYLGGKLHELDYAPRSVPCRMTIVQPKTSPPIRYQNDVSGYIMGQIKERGKAAALTDDPEAPLIAGKHCQWCKHKSNCTAGAEESMEVLKTMTTDVNVEGGKSLFEAIEESFGDITSLSDEKLADLADLKESLLAQFERVEEEIRSRIDQGVPVPGYTMAPGRGSNDWNVSEEEIEKVLKGRRLKKADIFPAKLITPGQLKKLECLTDDQKNRILEKYVSYKPSTKLTLKKVARDKVAASVDFTAEAAAEKQAPPVSFF